MTPDAAPGRPEWPTGSAIEVRHVRRDPRQAEVVVFQAAVGEDELFVRGEGPTREAAEAAAWQQYQQHLAPDHTHQFRTVSFPLGDAVCSVCGVFAMDLPGSGVADEMRHGWSTTDLAKPTPGSSVSPAG